MHARGWIALLCLALVLFTASSLPWAVVVPVWLFFAAIITVQWRRRSEHHSVPLFLFQSFIPSRAPPLA